MTGNKIDEDHVSTDGSDVVLQPYIAAGKVTRIFWPFRPEPHSITSYHAAQFTQEFQCIYRGRQRAGGGGGGGMVGRAKEWVVGEGIGEV